MTSREKLKKYMEQKCAIFLTYNSEVPIYVKEDYDEMDSLADVVIGYIWDELVLNNAVNPVSTCPQCILSRTKEKPRFACGNCGYRKRHSRCGGFNSDWSKIVNRIPFNSKVHADMIILINKIDQEVPYVV